jgi:hypothetical protein
MTQTKNEPTTIDRRTRIDLGILVALLSIGSGLLVGGVAAIFFFGSLKSDVAGIGKTLVKVEDAIKENTEQLQHEGKNLAVLQQIVAQHGVLIDSLRQRLAKLEQNPK